MNTKTLLMSAVYLFFCANGALAERGAEQDQDRLRYDLEQALTGASWNYVPPEGTIPDQEVALAVAEAVLSGVYGRARIQAERPFSAALVDGYWMIFGYLPPFTLGGVAEIIISKKTGQIMHIAHGK